MKEITGYKVADVAAGKVKDEKGRPAPKKVVEVLRRAGVVSFTCCRGIDWKVIGADAESLFKKLGRGRAT